MVKRRYVGQKEAQPRPSFWLKTPPATRESGSEEQGTSTAGLAATMGEVAETTGAGATAVVAVLAPVLAGTAAAMASNS